MPQHQLEPHFGGWIPSRPDFRRHQADASNLKVLPEVDPRKDMPAIFNQWALGACTIHADIAAFMYDLMLDGANPQMLCRLWGYFQERKKEGSLGQGDTGAMGSDGFWVAQHVGFPEESAWPYTWSGQEQDQAPDNSVFDPSKPPAKAVQDENYYKLKKPYATPPHNEQAFKAVLSNKQTIAFGFTVYESFESSEVAKTGIVPMPQRGERVLGGHEVLLVGYLKSEPNYGLVRNSWGTDWGIGGYMLMPWSMILSRSIASDHTTIQRPAGK